MIAAKKLPDVLRAHLLAITFACLAAAPLRAADDVTGEWEMKMDIGGRESFGALSITKKPDGSLAGKWGSSELYDVKLDGQKLTFVRKIKFGDQEFSMNFEGALKDGRLEGNLSSDRGNFAANGSRPKPRNPILGRWDVKYTIGDRDIDAKLIVSEGPGGLEAKWLTGLGESVVSNVKFQDGKLSLSRKTKIEEREFESTYDATVKDNKINGTIKGQFGEVPANGSRAGADLIGKWELTTTTDQGTRTSILNVFGDLSGRYELFGGEVPFKEAKLDGNQVAITIETGFGDQNFTIELKGKLDGKTLTGEVTSPRGTRQVSGKKLETAPASSALVGTWEITRESQQGARMSTLTVKPDLTATYTQRDNTVPVTDLRFEGDQLSFKVIVRYNDQEVPMEFKGKVDGSTLKGQFTSARGVREATGKKLNPTSL